MYPEVVTVGNGNKKKKIDENVRGGDIGVSIFLSTFCRHSEFV